MDIALLKALSELPGVSGREERVRRVIRERVGGLCPDVRQDSMGNLFATRRGPEGAKKVLLGCHIDARWGSGTLIEEGYLTPLPAHRSRTRISDCAQCF